MCRQFSGCDWKCLGAPPPPIYKGGSAPCDPLRRSSPLATLLLSSWRLGTESQLSLRSLAALASDFVFAKVPGPRRSADADLASLNLPHNSLVGGCKTGGWSGTPQATGVASRAAPTSSATPPSLYAPSFVMRGAGASDHHARPVTPSSIPLPREPPTPVMGGGDSPSNGIAWIVII